MRKQSIKNPLFDFTFLQLISFWQNEACCIPTVYPVKQEHGQIPAPGLEYTFGRRQTLSQTDVFLRCITWRQVLKIHRNLKLLLP